MFSWDIGRFGHEPRACNLLCSLISFILVADLGGLKVLLALGAGLLPLEDTAVRWLLQKGPRLVRVVLDTKLRHWTRGGVAARSLMSEAAVGSPTHVTCRRKFIANRADQGMVARQRMRGSPPIAAQLPHPFGGGGDNK